MTVVSFDVTLETIRNALHIPDGCTIHSIETNIGAGFVEITVRIPGSVKGEYPIKVFPTIYYTKEKYEWNWNIPVPCTITTSENK